MTSSSEPSGTSKTRFEQGLGATDLPEDPISEETVQLFNDDAEDGIQRSVQRSNDDLDNEVELSVGRKPWYRRPSPWWLLFLMPMSAMSLAAVAVPHVAVMAEVVCRQIHTNTTSFAPDVDCESDPKVHAIVSSVVATLTSIVGILSCITTPSWASLSDRIGRLPVLAMANTGSFIYYSSVIFVTKYAEHIPGGLWSLTIAAAIFGLFGGTATASAGVQSYIADCTPPSSRSRAFSLTLGLRFTGMAIGPAIGGLLIRSSPTHSPSIVLYLTATVHAIYALSVLFIVPEALSATTKAENRRHREETVAAQNLHPRELEHLDLGSEVKLAGKRLWNRAVDVVKPLTVVAPIKVHEDADSPARTTHTDWSLTFIALAACLASLILASYPVTFQYAAATFHWNPEQLSYWFSLIVAARAITLTLILPGIIKVYHIIKKRRENKREPEDSGEETALLSRDADEEVPIASRNSKPKKPHHSPAFDLTIAQCSLILEIVCFALVPVFRSRPTFVVFTVLAACGAGFGPAIQSLAVELYSKRGGTETGKLFGVLGVLQIISSQVFGPPLYGLTFAKAVGVYPEAIFFVSAAAVACATVALFFVELPRHTRLRNQV